MRIFRSIIWVQDRLGSLMEADPESGDCLFPEFGAVVDRPLLKLLNRATPLVPQPAGQVCLCLIRRIGQTHWRGACAQLVPFLEAILPNLAEEIRVGLSRAQQGDDVLPLFGGGRRRPQNLQNGLFRGRVELGRSVRSCGHDGEPPAAEQSLLQFKAFVSLAIGQPAHASDAVDEGRVNLPFSIEHPVGNVKPDDFSEDCIGS